MSSSKLSTDVLLCKLILAAFNIVELSVADPSKTFTAANEPILPISPIYYHWLNHELDLVSLDRQLR